VGLVTDVEPFLRVLIDELKRIEAESLEPSGVGKTE
jgi:hypothetical protein